MSEIRFAVFNNGDKKVVIRADKIVSALEVDHGCFINTDDGGEYEVSETIEQFLTIMENSPVVPSSAIEAVPEELSPVEIAAGLEVCDRNALLDALHVIKNIAVIKNISHEEFDGDVKRQVNVISLAKKALDAASRKNWNAVLMYLECIEREMKLHDGNISQDVTDAVDNAFVALRSLIKED